VTSGPAATGAEHVEDLLRTLAPQVLGVLVRRHGRFDACEDAVQEALVAAASQWPERGRPADPRAWLVTVANRRLIDEARRDGARRRRESADALARVPADDEAPPVSPGEDDTLLLLFLCCHPALSAPSQLALTLRAVGGLTTAEIARAFLVPESTMAQRISRAKQRIRAVGASFARPSAEEWDERLAVVCQVLYLMFNEGYTSSSGTELHRADLTTEAIRLAREVHRQLPDDSEITGLLALMLLTDARRPARTAPDGSLVPLAEQDRSRWDAAAIAEGVALVERALPHGPVGPYQVQAAIAAVHDEAPSDEATDWLQIVLLYELLQRIEPNPMVALNHAVAVAMVEGPRAGLDLLVPLAQDDRLAHHHRLHAVRAHLLERAGEPEAARAGYLEAARRTTSLPERRYLEGRAARLGA
jgi:RNA polymerase sigma factor (sigma-70 family)